MRILRWADYRRMPWKNGGGETAEIAAFPDSAGMDDFGWRLSMASVASDGPFSAFAGIDRTLTILDGSGIELVVGDAAPVRLTVESLPYRFAGDVPAFARLIDGPVLDLNVMTRRGRFAHAVERVVAPAAVEASALVCLGETVTVQGEELGPRDCALDVGGCVAIGGSGEALAIRIHSPTSW
jgi:environmental stress-induced protein Ves